MVPGRLQQRSTRLAFLVAGIGIAAWAPLVPFAKARLGLDEAALGLLLLWLGAGSMIAMPLAGAWAARAGCRRVLVIATVVMGLALPMLAVVSSVGWLSVAIFAFGAGLGSMDCVINIQAVAVERASGRPMMSGFHGLFSVGGIVGASGVSALLASGATPFVASLAVVAVAAGAIALAWRGLLPRSNERPGPAFVAPHGVVTLIGGLCFIVFLAEGARR